MFPITDPTRRTDPVQIAVARVEAKMTGAKKEIVTRETERCHLIGPVPFDPELDRIETTGRRADLRQRKRHLAAAETHRSIAITRQRTWQAIRDTTPAIGAHVPTPAR